MDYAKIAKNFENRKRMGIAPEPIDDLEVDRSDDPLCQIEDERMRDAAIADQEMEEERIAEEAKYNKPCRIRHYEADDDAEAGLTDIHGEPGGWQFNNEE